MYVQGDEGGSWDIKPKHRLNDEINQAMVLFNLLEHIRLENSDNGRKWADGRKTFSVKVVAYELMDQQRLLGQRGVQNFPVVRVWKKSFVPRKVGFFVGTYYVAKY